MEEALAVEPAGGGDLSWWSLVCNGTYMTVLIRFIYYMHENVCYGKSASRNYHDTTPPHSDPLTSHWEVALMMLDLLCYFFSL